MKQFFTLYITLFFINIITAQQINFCEDFEGYQNGNPIAQTSSDWNTWGELMSGYTAPFTDDANVSNVLSSSGNNSLYLFSGATQGLQDIILSFGSATPYTTGNFEFSANFFVNQGTGAYFNFQAENIPGTSWSLDCKMDLGGLVLENTGSGLNYLITTYPQGVWFELKLICDLINNNWELFINNQSQGSFTNTVNKIASLDLYPIIGHEFYVDDICYNYITPSWDCDGQGGCIDPGTGLGTHNSLINCQNNCITPSWDCDGQGGCIDPGTGFGQYDTLSNCELDCIFTTVKENNNKIKLIYPNPATDKIYISNLTDNTRLKIYDINGRIVLENKNSNKGVLNISTLAKGIYQVKFENQNWNETRRFIKE